MDIEGLGEKNVALFYETGLIKRFEDVYSLKKEDLLRQPRFAEKSAQNLIDAVERSKRTTLAKFLNAIGIPHVGEYGARLLAIHFKNLEDLYGARPERILEIKQVGETIATSVSTFFHDEGNLKTLESLKELGLSLENPDFAAEEKPPGALEGMTLVITGTLPVPRKEAEELIALAGGRAASQLSASTDYLVVGENPGSKLAKAEKSGVKTITYNELVALAGEMKGGQKKS